MKIICLMGDPGTGKTTLFHNLIFILNENEPNKFVEEGLVKYHFWPNQKVIVLGIYKDDEVFSGTDKYSMMVQPSAIEWIKANKNKDLTVFFEGDRLSTPSFLKVLTEEVKDNFYFLMLSVSEEEKQRRYKQRNSNQSEKFLKGRSTKYKNIKELFPVIELRNDTKEDGQKNLDILNKILSNNYTPEIIIKKRKNLF